VSATVTETRVRYAETDQMGVAYHANYLVWCEMGRTDFIREHVRSYADLEREGVALAVSEATIRFHAGARYDDLVRVETTLAEVRSRGLVFDYLITRQPDGERLASARIALVSIGPDRKPIVMPNTLRERLSEVRG
jgi:acyl-CoA thioester hydrolase